MSNSLTDEPCKFVAVFIGFISGWFPPCHRSVPFEIGLAPPNHRAYTRQCLLKYDCHRPITGRLQNVTVRRPAGFLCNNSLNFLNGRRPGPVALWLQLKKIFTPPGHLWNQNPPGPPNLKTARAPSGIVNEALLYYILWIWVAVNQIFIKNCWSSESVHYKPSYNRNSGRVSRMMALMSLATLTLDYVIVKNYLFEQFKT
jgi:hypothetical protein